MTHLHTAAWPTVIHVTQQTAFCVLCKSPSHKFNSLLPVHTHYVTTSGHQMCGALKAQWNMNYFDIELDDKASIS
jgi:hypothetical protein